MTDYQPWLKPYMRTTWCLQAATEQVESLRNDVATSEARNAELQAKLQQLGAMSEQLQTARAEAETLQRAVQDKDDALARTKEAAERTLVARRAAEAIAEDMAQKAQNLQAELSDAQAAAEQTRKTTLSQCASRLAACLCALVRAYASESLCACTRCWRQGREWWSGATTCAFAVQQRQAVSTHMQARPGPGAHQRSAACATRAAGHGR